MSVLPPVFVELKAKASEFHAALGDAEKDMQKLAKSAADHGEMIRQGLSKGFKIAGGAMAGAGAVLTELGDKQESTHKGLEQAVKNTGGAYEEYAKQISATVGHEEKFAHTADDTQNALAILTRATGNTGQAINDMGLVTEIAAVHHSSLADAAGTVAKMHAGSVKALKEFGISAKDLGDHVDFATASQLVMAKVQGTAAAQVDTFGGKLAGLKAHFEDMAGSIGSKVGPAMATAGPMMMGLGSIIESSIIPTLFEMGTSALTAAGEVILAVAPIAIPLAIVGVAAYELYKHWDQVWGFVKDIAKDAFDFVKKHMDLIIDVALGPIGVAVTLLSDHWSAVWGGMKTAVSDVAGFVAGAFKDAFNMIADLWNKTVGAIGFHIPDWVPGIGGKGFDMPKIPKFHQGGIVPGPLGTETLAILQAGERVTPISGAGDSGGTITVEVPIYLDSRQIGYATADHVQTALLRKSRNNVAVGLA